MMVRVTVTKEDEERIRKSVLEASASAIKREPESYRLLGNLVRRAMTERVDVDDYYDLARSIGLECKGLAGVICGTIFYHAHKNLDPAMYGKAETFRSEVKKLVVMMENLDEFVEGVAR